MGPGNALVSSPANLCAVSEQLTFLPHHSFKSGVHTELDISLSNGMLNTMMRALDVGGLDVGASDVGGLDLGGFGDWGL